MASFNLGKIKGDKGEKGDIGPKGEKGEKGDRGITGADGITPVFSIAQTNTLPEGNDAYVELDNSNLQNPVLTFNIPKGKDGLDASGDMQSALYDKNQRKTDVYEYAEKMAEDSFKKTGGSFIGKVKAYVSEPEDACVRNFSVTDYLPTDAKNGDICILTKKMGDMTLNDVDPGSIVLIKENGILREYIVFSNNTRYSGKTELIRRTLLNDSVVYDKRNNNTYAQSDMDIYVNSVFVNSLDETVRSKLSQVKVDTGITRSVFIASREEISEFGLFENNSPKAQTDDGSSGTYCTRSTVGTINVSCYNSAGEGTLVSASEKLLLRPVIVLSSDTCVENANTSAGIGFKIADDKGGVYIFKDGEWRGCEL